MPPKIGRKLSSSPAEAAQRHSKRRRIVIDSDDEEQAPKTEDSKAETETKPRIDNQGMVVVKALRFRWRQRETKGKAATIELLSDVAVVELAARLIAALRWTKSVFMEAMWANQGNLAVAPVLATGGLAVDLLSGGVL
ncbi:hypothetical protein F5Y13DRAFT_188481 [Hypoxylon sp. FL1857]|nr:hypothetical protein F5Y13DRAFT_188481 [Hypoxylon sp. FL1857]